MMLNVSPPTQTNRLVTNQPDYITVLGDINFQTTTQITLGPEYAYNGKFNLFRYTGSIPVVPTPSNFPLISGAGGTTYKVRKVRVGVPAGTLNGGPSYYLQVVITKVILN